MKIGEMFPSEYLRGIDVDEPLKLKIKSITEEAFKNHKTGRMETEYIMRFEGLDKKLRLNVTMAKQCATIFGVTETEQLIGKVVTVYRTTIEAFGETHIVPRVRKTEKGDKAPTPAKPMFDTLDDLFAGIYKAVGLDADSARAALKQSGFNGFKPSLSADMFNDVKSLVESGAFDPPTEPEYDPDKALFYDRVKDQIPYYGNDASIDEALKDMGILFDPENVDFIFEQLDTHANEAADAKEA